MWRSPALPLLRNRRRASPPLSAPHEQRAPTCSQHQQLADQSGPPSAAATPADWLLPVSFSRFLHSEWLFRPSIQMKACPSSRAGSSLGSPTSPRVCLSRRHRLSPDKSRPCAFPCHSHGTLILDWPLCLHRESLRPTYRRSGRACVGCAGRSWRR